MLEDSQVAACATAQKHPGFSPPVSLQPWTRRIAAAQVVSAFTIKRAKCLRALRCQDFWGRRGMFGKAAILQGWPSQRSFSPFASCCLRALCKDGLQMDILGWKHYG